jgi:hypothetical protein
VPNMTSMVAAKIIQRRRIENCELYVVMEFPRAPHTLLTIRLRDAI